MTAGGQTFACELPYLVFATQNPIEQEGTYPLPEAQLDRFMFMIEVGYPSQAEEIEIIRTTTVPQTAVVAKVLAPDRIRAFQELVLRVPVPEHVARYAVELARRSRPGDGAPAFVKEHLVWGAGPRAAQHLILGAKARALLAGRFAASVEDVAVLAKPVFRHRLILNFHAEAQRVTTSQIIDRLLSEVKP